MLIEMNVKNFRSIKDEVTLSMVASADESLEDHLIADALKDDRLLKCAALYGANASGKTNVLDAFYTLRELVVSSHRNYPDEPIEEYEPFRLGGGSNPGSCAFRILFIKDGVRFEYSVSFNGVRIIDESLHYSPKGKKALIFLRENTDEYKFTVDISEQKKLAERTRENVLYLSSSAQWNFSLTMPVFEWFKKDLIIVGLEEEGMTFDRTAITIMKNIKAKNQVLKMLREADPGIEDIQASSSSFANKDLFSDEPTADVDRSLFPNDELEEEIEIRTIHMVTTKGGKKKAVKFDFDVESEGTRRLFSLIGPWLHALNAGRTLIVDELDVKLHHLLSEFLIRLFHDPTQNKKNAQLIFATHNVNLLDQKLFRRDQIWFTEKNPENNSTDLYSLAEFSPRKDTKIQKGYLTGRYGAIPVIKTERIF